MQRAFTFFVLLLGSWCALAPQPVAAQGPKSIDEPLPPDALFRLGSTRLWHSGSIQKVAMSFDSRLIASADYWGRVRLWDADSGDKLRAFPKYTGESVAFSPDGKILAAGAKKIRLWNTDTGELIKEMPFQLPPSGNVMDLTFSPDGKFLASVAGRQGLAAGDSLIHIWDVAKGKAHKKLNGPPDGCYSVAFSPDGKTLAAGGGAPGYRPGHSKVQLWDVTTGKKIWEKTGHPTGVYSVSISADGKLLASSDAYEVRIWERETGKFLRKLSGVSYGVAFAPQGTRLATARPIRIYDAATGAVLKQMNQRAYTVAFAPNGQSVISGNREGMVKLWHAATGNEIVKRRGHQGEISSVAFSPCGRLIASASAQDQTMRIWGAASGAALRTMPLNSTVQPQWRYGKGQRIFFSPNSRRVAIFNGDGAGRFFDLAKGSEYTIKTANRTNIGYVMFPDWRNFAFLYTDSATRQLGISFWDLKEKKHQRSIFPFEKQRSSDNYFVAMALSHDGNVLAISGRPRYPSNRNAPKDAITLIDVDTGKKLRSFAPTYYVPDEMVFSPDGKLLASSCSGEHVFLWDVSTGQERKRLPGRVRNANNTPRFGPVTFSPNGKILATVHGKNQIMLYDAATAKVLKTFTGHDKYISSLAFSPDGTRLVSGGGDSTIYVWQVTEVAPKKAATREHLLRWWSALKAQNPVLARSALEQLAGAGEQTVAFLREKLKPAAFRDPDQIPKLVKDLANAKPKVRAGADQELRAFGSRAAPELFDKLLEKNTPLPVRKRIENILQFTNENPVSPSDLQHLRAVDVLEHIGSKKSLDLLAKLSDGSPLSQRTREAVAAVRRLRQRRSIEAFRVLTDGQIAKGKVKEKP